MHLSMKSIEEQQARILDELGLFQDWTERYEYVISLGKSLPAIQDDKKTEDHLIKGCQSQVWLDASGSAEQIQFFADSDSTIVKGLIALFVRVFDGQPADEILKSDMTFIEKTGLKEHLAPTRANALSLMLAEMKKYALNLSK